MPVDTKTKRFSLLRKDWQHRFFTIKENQYTWNDNKKIDINRRKELSDKSSSSENRIFLVIPDQEPETRDSHSSGLSKWQNVIPHFPKSKIDRFSINLSATVTTVSDFLYLCPIWETSIYIFWDAVRPYLPPGIWLPHRFWTSVRNSSW